MPVENKKIYFLSDFHLGAPNYEKSLAREKKIVQFLDSITADAAEIFIVGDMFDFWYEYKTVVPKGYTRIFGKLASLTDAGIPIHFFVGNHDMWMKDYLLQELNIPTYHQPKAFERFGYKLFVGHGDGLGPGDYGYKLLKKIFRNPICNWLFGVLHPNIGIGIANYFSRKSRAKTGFSDQYFLGEDKEWLIQYSKEILATTHYHYFVFGHRHFPMDIRLQADSQYINIGDWIVHYTYGVLDKNGLTLATWED